MKRPNHRWGVSLVALAALLLIVPVTLAADDDDRWRDTAELSFVNTSGNSESTTLGFANKLWREWEKSAFTLKAGGVKVDTTSVTRTADAGGVVTETKTDDTTAEAYYLNGRYDRKITERFFWFGGAGWDRNEPSGIKNRYIAEGGVGNIWVDEDDVKFSTSYALTFTKQDDVNPVAGVDDSFAGLRLTADYMHLFGDNTTYDFALIVDENLDETSDYRADMLNAVTVAMSKRLALKVALRLLYDNEPAFAAVPIVPTPVAPPNTVNFELDELDTIFTASLVINF